MKPRRERPRIRQARIAEFYPYASKRQLNRVKRAADAVVKTARRAGTLIPQPCEVCGLRQSKSEAHHEDYAKPLEVRWLCRYHHRQRDAELRDARRLIVRRAEAAALPLHTPLLRGQMQRPELPSRVGATTRHSFLQHYEAFDLVRDATVVISNQMDVARVNEALLARRLKISRQMVNIQFRGGIRSLKTLAAYAEALGCDVSISLRPKQAEKSA